MKHKFFTLLLCAILSLSNFIVTDAATSEIIPMTPDFNEESSFESRIDPTIYDWPSTSLFFNHAASLSMGLSFSGNTANCYLSVTGYPEVNKISAYLYLQKYSNGTWSTITGGAFKKEVNTNVLVFGPTKAVNSRGSYRLTAQIFVYTDDGDIELIEDVSHIEVY